MKADEKKQADQSIAQILDDIKDVIQSDAPNTDILQLTEKVIAPSPTLAAQSAPAQIQEPSPSHVIQPTKIEDKPEVKTPQPSQPLVTAPISAKQDEVEDILSNLDLMPKPQEKITNDAPPSELLDKSVIEQSKKTIQEIISQHDALHLHKSGIMLEDVVMEILKPQLSEWLNKNLPEIVTAIVQKEIKKIIP
jgi:hypothetical protein